MTAEERSGLTAFSDRFEIVRELGQGGMATVYLARDTKHDRLVAVKVLRAEVAAAIGVDHAVRRGRVVARSVTPRRPAAGRRSAAHRPRAAGALAYAHAHGIVHRDIKPENILLSAGHAVVSDFGIARAISAAGGPELTMTGVTIGTPLYMSPEQIVGDPVDGRSDIYSLGCVVYEMLAGAPPHAGPTSLAVLASHAVDQAPTVAPAEAFPEAKRAVQRALALDSTLAEAHTSLGIISVFHDWDWPTAAREFDRAAALDSTEARTPLFHAWYYAAQGRLEEALGEIETAHRMNPLSPIISARAGSVLYYLHRYDEAAAELRRAIAFDSSNLNARAELGRVLVQQHRYAEALAAFPPDIDQNAGHLGGGSIGYALAMAGRRSEAQRMRQRLEQRARVRYIEPEAFVMIALGLGDTTRALDELEHAVRIRSFFLPFITVDPVYAPLAHNPRFLEIVRTVGLKFPANVR